MRIVSSTVVAPHTMQVIVCKSTKPSGPYLSKPHSRFDGFIRPSIVTFVKGTCYILFTDTNNDPVTLIDNETLGNIEVVEVQDDRQSTPLRTGHPNERSQGVVRSVHKKDYASTELNCPDMYKDAVLALLYKYRAVIAIEREALGREVNIEMHITTSYGHYEYNVVPFGLKTAPSFFQRLMNTLFRFETGKGAGEIPISAYLDEILVHTPSVQTHLIHWEYVLRKFQNANLKLKLSKCNFFQSSQYFLGHEVSAKGYCPQTEKIKAIQQYPVLQKVDAVRSFLGMVYKRL